MDDVQSATLPLLLSDLGVLVERHWSAALAPYGISSGEFRVLAVLVDKGPMTPVEVGSCITLEQSLISRTAQRLFEKRLITRRRSRTDRRNVTLRATNEGEKLVRQLDQTLKDLAEELVLGIPSRRLQQATAAVAAMIGNMESSAQSQ